MTTRERKDARSDATNIETGWSEATAGTIGNAHIDSIMLPPKLQGRLALRPAELGVALGIGRNAAYRLCGEPGFPVVKLGNKIVVPMDGLRRWLDNQAERGLD